MLPDSIDKNNPLVDDPIQSSPIPSSNKDIAIWIRFLKHLGLSRLFGDFQDQREQSRITYSKKSLLLWAFSVVAFRQGSKNALQTTIESLNDKNRRSLAAFLEIENANKLPHSKTVDDYLRHINVDELNNVLMGIFKWGIKSKLFYNHAETLLPDNTYTLGCDGFWTHTYNKPHAIDEHGHNHCPYCLPRTRFAGTPKEETYWVHVFVTFLVIFPGGLKLPIYMYPLKNHQVDALRDHESFKQECELKAAQAVLPMIKTHFPRTSFLFVGDALYANEPFIKLCDSLRWDYLIVRKDNLKKLGKHCDELEKTDFYQKQCVKQIKDKKGKHEIVHQAKWFNNEAIGDDSYTNVIRFEESITDSNGITKAGYKGEWISGKPITKENCFNRVKRGRSRWEQEDFHNTSKNRGFDAKHDIARADPNLWLVWKMLMFIAFQVFELFRCTTMAQEACKKRSWMKFARDLLQQLVEICWSVIENSPVLQKPRIQFRFNLRAPP